MGMGTGVISCVTFYRKIFVIIQSYCNRVEGQETHIFMEVICERTHILKMENPKNINIHSIK